MIWLRYLPHLAVGLALAGAVYWVSEQRYAAGYLAGDQAGYLRGARDAHRLNDAKMLTLLAEGRAEAERVRREVSERGAIERRRIEDEVAAERARYAGTDADLRRVIARLRAVPDARGALPAADDCGRLPDPGAAGPVAPTVPAGLLSESDRIDLARVGAEADVIHGQYAICYRYADAMIRHQRQVRTP